MTRMSQSRAAVCLSALLAPLLTPSLPTQAETMRAIAQPPLKLSLDFKVPNRGAPPATAGGASRGNCLQGVKPLTALMPKQSIGLTLASHPSFFFYMPPSAAKTADFLLLSGDDTQVIYQTTLTLPAQPGIVQYQLSETAPALKVGNRYHWYVTISCDVSMGASGNPSAEGWIERTSQSLTLSQALGKAKPTEWADVYAQAGLWHETLVTLADLRRQNPDDAKALADWKSLMQSDPVGLGTIANEPVMEAIR